MGEGAVPFGLRVEACTWRLFEKKHADDILYQRENDYARFTLRYKNHASLIASELRLSIIYKKYNILSLTIQHIYI